MRGSSAGTDVFPFQQTLSDPVSIPADGVDFYVASAVIVAEPGGGTMLAVFAIVAIGP